MIRTARPADAPALAEIYRPYVTDTWISFEETPPDATEMRSRLTHGLKRFPWLVSEAGHDLVGYAYASEHRSRAAYRWSVDVTVYVRQGRHRQGVGRNLYAMLLPLLAQQ